MDSDAKAKAKARRRAVREQAYRAGQEAADRLWDRKIKPFIDAMREAQEVAGPDGIVAVLEEGRVIVVSTPGQWPSPPGNRRLN